MKPKKCSVCKTGRHDCEARNDGTLICAHPQKFAAPAGFVFDETDTYSRRVFVPGGSKRNSESTASEAARVVLTRGADIEIRKPEWLWFARLELGEINLICGLPGVSKSMLAIGIAAAVTRGSAWPDERGSSSTEPGSVLLLAAEDSATKTIAPRMQAAGADTARWALITAVRDADGERGFSLERDTRLLSDAVDELGGVLLVILDPVNSYLGSGKSNGNEEVRAALQPLSELAESRGFAVLVIMHTNKSADSAIALDKVGGSRAFTALARTVAFVGRNPNDDSQCVFATDKLNNATKPDPLAYSIGHGENGAPRIEWSAEAVDVDTLQMICGRAGPKSQTAEARQFITDTLADAGGWMLRNDLFELARGEFSESLLQVAAAKESIAKRRPKDQRNPPWYWGMPNTQPPWERNGQCVA